jgi:hypoxia-inducible factor (prolyl hydroxylase)
MASDSGGPGGPSASERDRQYCELCGKMENLLRCGRCRSSFYCCKEHQRQDWKKHKLVCQGGEAGSAPASRASGAATLAGATTGAAAAGARAAGKAAPSRRDCAEAARAPTPGDAAQARGGRGPAEPGVEEPPDRLSPGPERASLCPAGGAPGEALSPGGGLRPNGQTKPLPALKLALEYIVPCMNKHGICVVDDFLGRETGQQIGDEVRALHDTGKFTDGQLVSQKSDSSKDIRGDKIIWIEGKEPGCETIGLLMSSMDDLIRHCSGKLGNYKINGRTKVSVGDARPQGPSHTSSLLPAPATPWDTRDPGSGPASTCVCPGRPVPTGAGPGSDGEWPADPRRLQEGLRAPLPSPSSFVPLCPCCVEATRKRGERCFRLQLSAEVGHTLA